MLILGDIFFLLFTFSLSCSQLILFATSKDSEKFLPIFQEAVKAFKGKVIILSLLIDIQYYGC